MALCDFMTYFRNISYWIGKCNLIKDKFITRDSKRAYIVDESIWTPWSICIYMWIIWNASIIHKKTWVENSWGYFCYQYAHILTKTFLSSIHINSMPPSISIQLIHPKHISLDSLVANFKDDFIANFISKTNLRHIHIISWCFCWANER